MNRLIQDINTNSGEMNHRLMEDVGIAKVRSIWEVLSKQK